MGTASLGEMNKYAEVYFDPSDDACAVSYDTRFLPVVSAPGLTSKPRRDDSTVGPGPAYHVPSDWTAKKTARIGPPPPLAVRPDPNGGSTRRPDGNKNAFFDAYFKCQPDAQPSYDTRPSPVVAAACFTSKPRRDDRTASPGPVYNTRPRWSSKSENPNSRSGRGPGFSFGGGKSRMRLVSS